MNNQTTSTQNVEVEQGECKINNQTADTPVLDVLVKIACYSSILPAIPFLFLSNNIKIGFLLTFIIAGTCMALNLVLYKFNKTKSPFKTLDVMFIIIGGALTIAAWTFPEKNDLFKNCSGIITNSILTVGVGVTWLLGHPFVKDIVTDKIDDPIKMTHPMTKFVIHAVTGIWFIIFILLTLVSIPDAVVYLNSGDKAAGTLYTVTTILGIAIPLSGPIWMKLFFRYFKANKENIAERYYKVEIDEWNTRYPDHELAGAYTSNSNGVVDENADENVTV